MKILRELNIPVQQHTTNPKNIPDFPRENPGKYLEIQGTVIEYREPNEHNIRNRTSSGRNRERSIFEGANTMER
jgi:hypothetical protein